MKQIEIIEKWNSLISQFDIEESKKMELSKLVESIIEMNSLKDSKFLISAAIKLITNTDIIIKPMKKSYKREKLFDLEEETLYDNGQIMTDGAIFAMDRIISEILKLSSDKKIISIEMVRDSGLITFNLIY